MDQETGKNMDAGRIMGFLLAALPCFLAVIPALGVTPSGQSLPRLDFNDFGGYMRQLQGSDDPRARVILQQIEQGPADLEREKRAARREGIAIDPRELRRPLPPPDQNAAPLYTQLAALERSHPLHLPEYADALSSRYAYTSEQLAAVRKLLHDHRDIMDLVHRIGDRPQCVFPRDWSKGQMIFLPEFATMRHVARLLKTESFLLARQGHYDEAIADEVGGFRVAEHATADPLLISYLVGVACEGIALSGMKDILLLAGPNAASIDRRVERAIAIHHSRISLRNSLIGETSFALSGMEPMRREGPHGLAEMTNADGGPAGGQPRKSLTPAEKHFFDNLVDAQAAYHLHRLRRLVAAADGPVPVRRAVFAHIGEGDPQNPVALLGNTVLPVYATADQRETWRDAQEEVTMAGAAILERGARTGHLPSRLPVRFMDPFTGRPLQYRRQGKAGFVVSSAGPGGPAGQFPSNRSLFFKYPPVTPQPVPPPTRLRNGRIYWTIAG